MQTEGEKLPSSSVGANGTCKRRLSDTSLSSQARRESDPGKQLPEGSQEEDAQKNEHAESEPPSQPQLQQDPPTAAESLTLNRNKSILERLREWDPAVELPNKGAVARDHLANEVNFFLQFCPAGPRLIITTENLSCLAQVSQTTSPCCGTEGRPLIGPHYL